MAPKKRPTKSQGRPSLGGNKLSTTVDDPLKAFVDNRVAEGKDDGPASVLRRALREMRDREVSA